MNAETLDTHKYPEPLHERPPLSEEVQANLSRLAVLHELPNDEGYDELYNATNKYHDRAERKNMPGYFVAEPATRRNATEQRIEPTADSQEKSRMLGAVHDAIAEQALAKDGELDWAQVSYGLLEKAKGAEGESKDIFLVSAVACTQFASNTWTREDFLKKVYDKDIQEDVAQACETSHIILLIEGPAAPYQESDKTYRTTTVHPIKRFAPAFRIDTQRLHTYLEHLPEAQTEPSPNLPTPKRLQKDLVAQSEAGEIDEETSRQAHEASLSGDKVGSTLMDITKLERFALQQYFIKEQMKEVLAGPDLGHTAFSEMLGRRRHGIDVIGAEDAQLRKARHVRDTGIVDRHIAQLVADVESVISELSQAAIQRFSLAGVDLNNRAALTPEQRAAERFRMVVEQVGQHNALSQYLDFENFTKRSRSEVLVESSRQDLEIWSVSEDGAAAPNVAGEAIKNVINGALRSKDGGPITPEELRDYAHSNRRKLLMLATYNITDMSGGDVAAEEAVMLRDKHGRLQLKNDFVLPRKEGLDLYAAVVLGCPALREQHPDRTMLTMEERAAYGSSNYIDHLLAGIINEAYERGLFDLEMYRQQIPQGSGRHRVA